MSSRDWRHRIEDIVDIDPGILWDTVHNDLPKLVEPLKRLLA